MSEEKPGIVRQAGDVAYREPVRVVVEASGTGRRRTVDNATTPKRARERYGITPDVVLYRDDGWSLGARFEDAEAAYATWPKEWVYFVYRDPHRPEFFLLGKKLGDFRSVVARALESRSRRAAARAMAGALRAREAAVRDDRGEIPKQPRNVAAILEWYRATKPGDLEFVETVLRSEAEGDSRAAALLVCLLHGFEAGRVFQSRNPDVPLGGGAHYRRGRR